MSLRLTVQWSKGATLPIITSEDATADTLSRLLRFACAPGEVIILFCNGAQLNPQTTLRAQNVLNNDVIQAQIIRAADKDDTKMNRLVLETAKLCDRTFNRLNFRGLHPQFPPQISSDESEYEGPECEMVEIELPGVISVEPLPVIWASERDDLPSCRKGNSVDASEMHMEGKWNW